MAKCHTRYKGTENKAEVRACIDEVDIFKISIVIPDMLLLRKSTRSYWMAIKLC